MTEHISSDIDGARERLKAQARGARANGEHLVAEVAELIRERDELLHQVEMLSAAHAEPEKASEDTPALTLEEAAQMARRSTKTVRRAVVAGKLRASKLGGTGRPLFREADVRDWIEGHPARPPAPRRPRAAASGRPKPGSVADLREIERELTR